jgi:osmotically-inducible protein OsmY
MSSKLIPSSTLILALAAATALGACGRNDSHDDVRVSAGTSSNAATDMAITATVKTRLAADTELSALAINVDTRAGHVVLHGTAPDTAARTHATELARSVEGVVAVDNALTVQAASK